jgi:hypothetical protein
VPFDGQDQSLTRRAPRRGWRGAAGVDAAAAQVSARVAVVPGTQLSILVAGSGQSGALSSSDDTGHGGSGGSGSDGFGGGGGAGFGGGGAGEGGGGGGGYGAGGGAFDGGGGGSSWVVPGATLVGSKLAATVTAPLSGTADLAVPVTLSSASSQTVTAQWTTEFVPGAPDSPILGTQAPTTDYARSSGTVTFAPGEASEMAHVPVSGDNAGTTEFLVISISDATHARIGGSYGLGFGVIRPGA